MANPPTPKTQTRKVFMHPTKGAVYRPAGYEVGDKANAEARRISPDATGFYESELPPDETNSTRLLQLNQAGHWLVGWITTPPSFIDRSGRHAVRMAVLVADITIKSGSSSIFYYKAFDGDVNDKDPTDVLSPFDPWDASTAGPEDVMAGSLEVKGNEGNLEVVLQFQLEDGSKEAVRFFQVNTSPRTSFRTIKGQTEPLRTVLCASHQQPIPKSFFDTSKPSGRQWKKAKALFTREGPLAPLIEDFVETIRDWGQQHDKLRIIAVKICDVLDEAMGPQTWSSTLHAQILNLRLIGEAQRQTLTLRTPFLERHLTKTETQEKSFLDWLSFINLYYTKNLGSRAATWPQFMRLLATTKVYRYDLSFSTIPYSAKVLPGLVWGIGAFQVSVLAFGGTRQLDGSISDWKRASPDEVSFVGAFTELKGGLGGVPRMPSQISLFSSDELVPGDFKGAVFEVYSVEVFYEPSAVVSTPLAKVGGMPSTGAKTQLLRIHIKHTVLEATYDKLDVIPDFKIAKDSLKHEKLKWDEAKKLFQFDDSGKRKAGFLSTDFKYKTADMLNVGISLGLGCFFVQYTSAEWIVPPPPAASGRIGGSESRRLAAAFTAGDHTLSTQVKGWPIRDLLEIMLATELALFNGAANVTAEGFASPEDTPQYNFWLAWSRANAVLQAIEDAIGPLPTDLKGAWGFGDESAKKIGHLTDPDPGSERDPEAVRKFKKEHKEEVAKWPRWRRVEVKIRGHFFIDIETIDGSDRTP